ncbi:MAG: MBL fold metallo-hydrolase [Candidatus Margulisbacteria bacterium]|jgi:glyoxylase-like metal-dependent hydrolase (beta-lactamase superfamily II)|nr:MBL fold metallo-hydrolase [Candidatus Margulisiibacteriota bacterium]
MIERIIVGPLSTNCYLAAADAGAVIIDPGAAAERIAARIAEKKLQPLAILNTHGHWDHVMANNELKKKYNIPVYTPFKDRELLAKEKDYYHIGELLVDHWYADALSGLDWLRVIPTPGHTPGSSCLLWGKNLFSGDTLFAGGYLGRTDLWGGDGQAMQDSLQKLLLLPDDVAVWPGHAESSTIGAERKYYA